MATVAQLKKEVKEIKKRNKSVEGDKAWETSYSRRVLLAVFTYLAIALYLQAINIPDAWLNAIGATAGFMISTLTLPFFKKLWLKHFFNK
ncbi:hypothetical protein ACFLQ2_04120 [archaeon]